MKSNLTCSLVCDVLQLVSIIMYKDLYIFVDEVRKTFPSGWNVGEFKQKLNQKFIDHRNKKQTIAVA